MEVASGGADGAVKTDNLTVLWDILKVDTAGIPNPSPGNTANGRQHHTGPDTGLLRQLPDILEELVKKDEFVLIYPEQEMWFNYRRPRPPRKGAYHFAAKLKVPVISCFVEMRDEQEMDTKNFHKVRYTLHILDVLYPDPQKSVRENSAALCEKDYALKKEAYERIYGKPLSYAFEPSDIAGWTGENPQ